MNDSNILTITALTVALTFLGSASFADTDDDTKKGTLVIKLKNNTSSDSESTSETEEDFSITTTSSASSATSDEEEESDKNSWEVLSPEPREVKKYTKKRSPKHAAAFKEVTEFSSAREYVADQGDDSIPRPQIGHIQSYQNHGPSADTHENNLAVIGQTTNGKMKVYDAQIKNGDIDAPSMIVKESTRIAVFSIQQLANPSDSETALTPAIVISASLSSTDVTSEENEKFKKRVERALSPERKEEMRVIQEERPGVLFTVETYSKKVISKLREYEKMGRDFTLGVLKFSDQSRALRKKHNDSDHDGSRSS